MARLLLSKPPARSCMRRRRSESQSFLGQYSVLLTRNTYNLIFHLGGHTPFPPADSDSEPAAAARAGPGVSSNLSSEPESGLPVSPMIMTVTGPMLTRDDATVRVTAPGTPYSEGGTRTAGGSPAAAGVESLAIIMFPAHWQTVTVTRTQVRVTVTTRSPGRRPSTRLSVPEYPSHDDACQCHCLRIRVKFRLQVTAAVDRR